jgi:hypothetical protein
VLTALFSRMRCCCVPHRPCPGGSPLCPP